MNKIELTAFFNSEYNSCRRYWWQGENRYSCDPQKHLPFHAKLLEIAQSFPRGRALDIGTGEGADAIRLALLGYEVDAVDISAIAIEKTAAFAKTQGVKLNLFNQDINSFPFDKKYDIIICNGMLHYVRDKIQLLKKIQVATTCQGYNVVSLFSTASPIPDYHQCVEVYPDSENGVVFRHFQDWKSFHKTFERNKIESSHPTITPHYHSYIKLISQKFHDHI